MILLVTRSLIRWLSNSLLKFSIHTHSTIYFGKTLVELSGTMKWNEMKKLNILTLFSHLLLSQQIVKCTLLSAILPFSTKAVVKYQLMIAGKLMKKTYWERENIQNIMKKRCAIVCFCHSFQYFLFPLSLSYYTLISCPVCATASDS